jgi:uncharacterized membrane protein YeaQ/YmgE (transglycosylase-associated protein family)
MHIVWAVLSGLVIGTLARVFLTGKQRIPLWLTIFLGICGGLVGNVLATKLGVRHTRGIDWWRHVLQICSAGVLIGVIGPLWGGRRRRS